MQIALLDENKGDRQETAIREANQQYSPVEPADAAH
jgi:hypothetical protein